MTELLSHESPQRKPALCVSYLLPKPACAEASKPLKLRRVMKLITPATASEP